MGSRGGWSVPKEAFVPHIRAWNHCLCILVSSFWRDERRGGGEVNLCLRKWDKYIYLFLSQVLLKKDGISHSLYKILYPDLTEDSKKTKFGNEISMKGEVVHDGTGMVNFFSISFHYRITNLDNMKVCYSWHQSLLKILKQYSLTIQIL